VDDGAAPPAPRRAVPGPGRLSPAITALAGVVLVAFIALAVWLHLEPSRLPDEEAERALALIVGRDLDVQVALDVAPAWERRLYTWLMLEAVDGIEQGLEWYRELAEVSHDPTVDLHLAMLLGEAGRLEEVAESVAGWRGLGPPYPTFAQAMASAYLGEDIEPQEARALVEALAEVVGEDTWFRDRLAMLLAGRAGDVAAREAAEAARDARAYAMLRRARVLLAVDVATLAAAAVAFAVIAARRRRGAPRLRVADADLPPPWPPGRALAVLLQGGAAGVVVLMAFLLTDVHDDLLRVTTSLAANAAALPLLAMASRHLLRPAGQRPPHAFGLVPGPGAWPRLGLVTLVLVGAGALGDWASAALGDALESTSHWTEWFDADLVWGSAPVAGIVLLDACVFAPVLEETIFRGLLYGALRTRLHVGPAALASAGIFAAAHGYGLIGFASVLVSGCIWAWAYERTRSLLPGMIAHGVNNVAASLAVMALYRG
jgi:membrane protease YdiL (CAAX protease family)